MKAIEVNEIKFHAATPSDMERGLLGWTSFVLNGAVLIEGVALRRSIEGKQKSPGPKRRPSKAVSRRRASSRKRKAGPSGRRVA